MKQSSVQGEKYYLNFIWLDTLLFYKMIFSISM